MARLRRELAEVKMERDILKKQQRTLQRSRSKVRGNKGFAAQVSLSSGLPGT